MENEMRSHVPESWDLSLGSQVEVEKNSEEFAELKGCFPTSGAQLKKLVRIQNLYTFGQVLIREQFLLTACAGQTDYYRVRRYKKVSSNMVDTALGSNLDERRMYTDCQFESQLSSIALSDVILIIQAITSEPYNKCLTPDKSNDYYIEYVAYF